MMKFLWKYIISLVLGVLGVICLALMIVGVLPYPAELWQKIVYFACFCIICAWAMVMGLWGFFEAGKYKGREFKYCAVLFLLNLVVAFCMPVGYVVNNVSHGEHWLYPSQSCRERALGIISAAPIGEEDKFKALAVEYMRKNCPQELSSK